MLESRSAQLGHGSILQNTGALHKKELRRVTASPGGLIRNCQTLLSPPDELAVNSPTCTSGQWTSRVTYRGNTGMHGDRSESRGRDGSALVSCRAAGVAVSRLLPSEDKPALCLHYRDGPMTQKLVQTEDP